MPSYVSRRAPGSAALAARRVKSLADQMLRALELESAELSVLLTNDSEIHELNRVHRGKDKPTDVLAFALEEADTGGEELPFRVLGDVVISLDTAERQARQRRHELVDEVRFLLAHGLLHLIGYDHQTDAEEAEMDAETRRLVEAAGGPIRPKTPPATKKKRQAGPRSRKHGNARR
ncbi:MAG: rRNA maturation RNase YbeY [Polyangiaceae bacterium]